MNKIGLLAATLVLLAPSCKDKNAFILTGEVADAGLNGKTVYLQKINEEKSGFVSIDSTTIENGKFVFKGIAEEQPNLHFVTIQSPATSDAQKPYVFILEAGNIGLSIDSVTTIKGTPMNEQYQQLETEKNKLYGKMTALREEYAKLVIAGELTPEEQNRFDSVFEKSSNDLSALFFEYAKTNMTNPVGEFIFESVAGNLSPKQLKELLALARPEFKKNENIQQLEKQLVALENTVIGAPFVDLKAKTPEGNDIALSDYAGKGNVVLLDFWASWCAPCRQEMPAVVEAYRKYKNKGFEIVGVSLDQDPDAWVKAIETLNITWPQMSDLKAWESALSAAYGVNSIPHTVLLDKDGKIIAKDLRGEALQLKLKELLN
jgi:peroxiredoxin